MNIVSGCYAVMLIIFATGIYMTFQGFIAGRGMFPVRYRDGPLYRFRKVKTSLMDQRQDYIFSDAGINMNINKYQTIRKLILLFFLFLGVLNLIKGDVIEARKYLLWGIIIYYLSFPKEKQHGKKTLFYYALYRLKKHRADAMDEELTGIIMQMKNIIISRQEEMSANYILTRLVPFTKLTKKAFIEALRYIRQGENEKACKNFEKTFGTKIGTMFANIIVKLDELPVNEFIEQLGSIQKKAEAERRTRKNSKKTKINTIRYTFALSEGFVIALLFMYLIAIDSMKALELLR